MVALSGIDWDAGNLAKCESHGVSIGEIESLFKNQPRFAPDMAHSDTESRFIAVGKIDNGRALFIAFTFRDRDGKRFVRPISARYMHAKELRRYAEEGTDPEDG